MKRILVVSACSLVLGTMSAYAAEWKGVISDAMCGAKHADASDKSIACVKKCVKGGSDAVLITPDNQVVTIDKDSQEKVAPMLGQKVTVTGTLANGNLKIDSISKM